MNERMTVSFPNMGLDLNVPREAFRIFNMPIYWYGIIIATALLVCVIWAWKDSKKFGIDPETVIDLMLFAAPIAIVFARLYFVVFSWDNYKDNLIDIINLRKGGLAIYGGIIGAVITAYFVARYKKLSPVKFFDFAIPYVALGQAIGRWGNFFNQEAFGTNTSLPWGMTSPTIKSYLAANAEQLQALNGITVNPDLPVHPTFLYESIWNIGVFALLMWLRRKKKFDGEVFCMYFVVYSLGRAVIEGLRTDSLMIGSLRVSQLLSILLLIAFAIYIIYKRVKTNNSTEEVVVGQSGYANILKIMEDEEAAEAAQAAEAAKQEEIKRRQREAIIEDTEGDSSNEASADTNNEETKD